MLYILHVEILHMYIRDVEIINCEKTINAALGGFSLTDSPERESSPRSISHRTGILGGEINHSLPSPP